MSSRLKKTESPGHALRRVCRWHADQALACLRKAHQPEGVHEVRKEIKRLRAIFRLASGSLSGKAHRQVAKTMRLAAKPLAASRDARVTKMAFASLVGRKARQFPNLRSALETHCRNAECRFKDHDSGAMTQHVLKKIGGQLHDLKLKQAGWPEIRVCLKKRYRRGRGAWKLARIEPSADHFHEWRKAVKDLGYQIDFLCPAWPPKTKAMLDGLKELGEQLGDEHDLVLLDQFVNKHGVYRQETAALQPLIDAKRGQFGAKIRRLGSRLYAKTPEAFCVHLEQDWKAWRGR